MIVKDTLSKIVIFAVGAGVGSAATWYYLKGKYEQQIREEIDSVYESFSDKPKVVIRKEDPAEKKTSGEQDLERLNRIVKDAGYTEEGNINIEEDEDMIEPYVIPPEEFDENGYDTESLTYYEDGVLEDERGNIIMRVFFKIL